MLKKSLIRTVAGLLLTVFFPQTVLQAVPELLSLRSHSKHIETLQVWSNFTQPGTAGNLFIVGKIMELAMTHPGKDISLMDSLIEVERLKPLIPLNTNARIVFDFRNDPLGMYGKYVEEGRLIIPFSVYDRVAEDPKGQSPFRRYEVVISADGTNISIRPFSVREGHAHVRATTTLPGPDYSSVSAAYGEALRQLSAHEPHLLRDDDYGEALRNISCPPFITSETLDRRRDIVRAGEEILSYLRKIPGAENIDVSLVVHGGSVLKGYASETSDTDFMNIVLFNTEEWKKKIEEGKSDWPIFMPEEVFRRHNIKIDSWGFGVHFAEDIGSGNDSLPFYPAMYSSSGEAVHSLRKRIIRDIRQGAEGDAAKSGLLWDLVREDISDHTRFDFQPEPQHQANLIRQRPALVKALKRVGVDAEEFPFSFDFIQARENVTRLPDLSVMSGIFLNQPGRETYVTETGLYGRVSADYIAVHTYSRDMDLVPEEDEVHVIIEISGESEREKSLIVAVHRDPDSWEYVPYAYYDIDIGRFRECSSEAISYITLRIPNVPAELIEQRINDLDVNTAVIGQAMSPDFWEDFGLGRGRHMIAAKVYEGNIYPKSAEKVREILDHVRADFAEPVLLDLFGGSGNFVRELLSGMGERPVPRILIVDQNENNVRNASLFFSGNDKVKAVRAKLGTSEGAKPLEDVLRRSGFPGPHIVTVIGGLNEHVTGSKEEAENVAKEIYEALPGGGYLLVTGVSMSLLNKKDFERIGFKVVQSLPPGYSLGDQPNHLYVLEKRSSQDPVGQSAFRRDEIVVSADDLETSIGPLPSGKRHVGPWTVLPEEGPEYSSVSVYYGEALRQLSGHEPHLLRDDDYASVLRNIACPPFITPETLDRRRSIIDAGEEIVRYFREISGNEDLQMSIIVPGGSVLKGYASETSDTDFPHIILFNAQDLKGKLKESNRERGSLAADIKRALDSIFGKYAINITSGKISAHFAEDLDVKESSLPFYPVMYSSSGDEIDKIRRVIIQKLRSRFRSDDAAKLQWDLFRDDFGKFILFDFINDSWKQIESIRARPYLAQALRTTGIDVDDYPSIFRFIRRRETITRLPDFSVMSDIFMRERADISGRDFAQLSQHCSERLISEFLDQGPGLFSEDQLARVRAVLRKYGIDGRKMSLSLFFQSTMIDINAQTEVHEILIDEFIKSFYEEGGVNQGKRHSFGQEGRESEELESIARFVKDVLGDERMSYMLELYGLSVSPDSLETRINVLRMEGSNHIFDAHASARYGINILDSCADMGEALVHELAALSGSAYDTLNRNIARMYVNWRDGRDIVTQEIDEIRVRLEMSRQKPSTEEIMSEVEIPQSNRFYGDGYKHHPELSRTSDKAGSDMQIYERVGDIDYFFRAAISYIEDEIDTFRPSDEDYDAALARVFDEFGADLNDLSIGRSFGTFPDGEDPFNILWELSLHYGPQVVERFMEILGETGDRMYNFKDLSEKAPKLIDTLLLTEDLEIMQRSEYYLLRILDLIAQRGDDRKPYTDYKDEIRYDMLAHMLLHLESRSAYLFHERGINPDNRTQRIRIKIEKVFFEREYEILSPDPNRGFAEHENKMLGILLRSITDFKKAAFLERSDFDKTTNIWQRQTRQALEGLSAYVFYTAVYARNHLMAGEDFRLGLPAFFLSDDVFPVFKQDPSQFITETGSYDPRNSGYFYEMIKEGPFHFLQDALKDSIGDLADVESVEGYEVLMLITEKYEAATKYSGAVEDLAEFAESLDPGTFSRGGDFIGDIRNREGRTVGKTEIGMIAEQDGRQEEFLDLTGKIEETEKDFLDAQEELNSAVRQMLFSNFPELFRRDWASMEHGTSEGEYPERGYGDGSFYEGPVIAVGGSRYGYTALRHILETLPEDHPPVVASEHLTPYEDIDGMRFHEFVTESGRNIILTDNDEFFGAEPWKDIYLVNGMTIVGRYLTINRDGFGRLYVRAYKSWMDRPRHHIGGLYVRSHRRSSDMPEHYVSGLQPIDNFFMQASDSCGENLICIETSGVGNDGGRGANYAKERGARILAQKVVPGGVDHAQMPFNIMRDVPGAESVLIDNMAGKIQAILEEMREKSEDESRKRTHRKTRTVEVTRTSTGYLHESTTSLLGLHDDDDEKIYVVRDDKPKFPIRSAIGEREETSDYMSPFEVLWEDTGSPAGTEHVSPPPVKEIRSADPLGPIHDGRERASSGYLIESVSPFAVILNDDRREMTVSPAVTSHERISIAGDYVGNIGDIRELANTLQETFRAYALSGKKLVIAMESGLHGGQVDAERIRRSVERWKGRMLRAPMSDAQKQRIERQLKNIVVFSFSGHEELEENLRKEGITRQERDNYIFAFANDLEKICGQGGHLPADIRPVIVNEGQGFGVQHYYPIAEVIIMSVAGELLGLAPQELMAALRSKGVSPENFGIEIVPEERHGTAGIMVINLIPSIERYDTEDYRDRFTRLLYFLQSA